MVLRVQSVLGVVLALALQTTWAMDTSPTPAATAKPAAADKLGAARALIAQKNWSGAVSELQRVNDTGSADWNSLMGYTLRKTATPDYASAGKYYDAALRIDPKHRGALEYSGELYLMTDDLPKAEARVVALDQVCAGSCDEATELKKAVARYKANGNKYVAAPW